MKLKHVSPMHAALILAGTFATQASAQTIVRVSYPTPATRTTAPAVGLLRGSREAHDRTLQVPDPGRGERRARQHRSRPARHARRDEHVDRPGVELRPEVGIVDIPFLFRDYAHARRVLTARSARRSWRSSRPRGSSRWPGPRTASPPDEQPPRCREAGRRQGAEGAHDAEPGAHPGLPVDRRAADADGVLELVASAQQGWSTARQHPIPVILASSFLQVQKHLSLTGQDLELAIAAADVAQDMEFPSEADRRISRKRRGRFGRPVQRVNDDEAAGIAQLRSDGLKRLRARHVVRR